MDDYDICSAWRSFFWCIDWMKSSVGNFGKEELTVAIIVPSRTGRNGGLWLTARFWYCCGVFGSEWN